MHAVSVPMLPTLIVILLHRISGRLERVADKPFYEQRRIVIVLIVVPFIIIAMKTFGTP